MVHICYEDPYQTHWVLTCHKEETPAVEMGVLDSNGDVTWNDTNTKAAFGLDGEGMNKELRTFRRG